MRLGNYRKFNRSDHPDAPPRFEDFIRNLDDQVGRITQLVQNHASFIDQFNAKELQVEYSDGQTATFRVDGLRGQVRYVMVAAAFGVTSGAAFHAKLRWAPRDEQEIDITLDFEPTPSERVIVRLLIFGDG